MTATVPAWAREWFASKQALALSKHTLARYAADLKALNLDISKSSPLEIKGRLAECAEHYSRSTQRHLVILAKDILRSLGRESEAKDLRLPKHADPRVIVYSPEELEQIYAACGCLRDRLMIRILDETGARHGELWNMKIKDIQFDEDSGKLWLHGKTGSRLRRVYKGKALLREYLEAHPHRDNPEAKFWLNQYGNPLSYGGIWRTVHRIGLRALNRMIFPHGFRHTAASRDLHSYMDRELMVRYGWKRPDMIDVYGHLNMRDVDEKDLALHRLNDRTCPQCHGKISTTAKFCESCGRGVTTE
jgi:integrase/recombinase XerD